MQIEGDAFRTLLNYYKKFEESFWDQQWKLTFYNDQDTWGETRHARENQQPDHTRIIVWRRDPNRDQRFSWVIFALKIT